MKAHLESLETLPTASFTKPPHLGPLSEGLAALEDACELKFNHDGGKSDRGIGLWDDDWRPKVRVGYERVSQTLWRVAREFDIRGYGLVLRDKLTSKWCDCGCSTDHLGEVCEKTVREDEEDSGVRPGKEREWDGRGLCCFNCLTRWRFVTATQAPVYMAGRPKKRKIFGRSIWISITRVPVTMGETQSQKCLSASSWSGAIYGLRKRKNW